MNHTWHRFRVWQRAVHIAQIRGKDYSEGKLERHECQNCGEQFNGNYCPRCGQTIKVERITMKNLISTFFREFTDLEDGFLYTIFELFYRPGYMIRDYLQGKRAHYFKPFKLLIIVGTVFFILARILDPAAFSSNSSDEANYNSLTRDLQTLRERALVEESRELIDQIQVLNDSVMSIEWQAIQDSLRERGGIDAWNMNDSYLTFINRLRENATEEQVVVLDSLRDKYMEASANLMQRSSSIRERLSIEDSRLNSLITTVRGWVQSNGFMGIIGMLPLFLLLSWIAFRKTPVGKKMNLAEYIIVFVYQWSQLLIISLALLMLTGSLSNSFFLFGIMMMIMLIYDYRQLFGISWFSSFWRTTVVMIGGTMLITWLLRFIWTHLRIYMTFALGS